MTSRNRGSFGWAIIGPGGIANAFADAVENLDNTHVAAIWGRSRDQAARFAARLPGSRPRTFASLDDLLADPEIDAVYVATTHDAHLEFAGRALRAGKPVICEKPLTPSHASSRELVELARARNVFLMEALWTRFLPVYARVEEWLRSDAIGAVKSIHSAFCFAEPFNPASRLFDPERAGGALLDIGIYNLAMTRWVLSRIHGKCPRIVARSFIHACAPTGVDMSVSGQYQFECGTDAQFTCALDRIGDNALRIFGTKGAIVIPDKFWQADNARLYRAREAPVHIVLPHRVNGFEFEIEEAIRCVRAGLLESPTMPHGESLALAQWLDDARNEIGVRYPFEAPAGATHTGTGQSFRGL
jgi:predicted dehydrogenase